MLTNRFIFTLLALAIAPVLSAPVPSRSSNSLIRRGEDSVDIVARAPLPEPASGKSNQRAPAAKSKSKSTKSKAVGKTKTKSKTKHVKNAKWLYRRTGGVAKVGETLTIGTHSAKLEAVPGLSNDGRSCAVFMVTWDGKKAFAKQNVNEGEAKFTDEITKTKLVKNAIAGDLYIADGTFNGHHWLITKAMEGKTFAKLKVAGKLDTLGKDKAIAKATETVVNAQKWLSESTKFIQGDLNQGNWLFSDDLEHVNVIDMGEPAAAPAWSDFMAKRQKSQWTEAFTTGWDHAALIAEKSKSKSK